MLELLLIISIVNTGILFYIAELQKKMGILLGSLSLFMLERFKR